MGETRVFKVGPIEVNYANFKQLGKAQNSIYFPEIFVGNYKISIIFLSKKISPFGV